MKLISKRSAKRRIMIIAVCVIVALIVCLFVCLRQCNKTDVKKPSESTGGNSLDFIPADDDTKNTITMPGYEGLVFNSGKTTQKIDLYNPQRNNCVFVFSIWLSDNTLIYKSDYVKPGEHLQEITLNQVLQKGTYLNCRLVIECYSNDESLTQLNGSSQTLQIKSN